jgi:chromosomal replication initiation ATPase DnaA
MTPRVKQYVAEEAARTGLLEADVVRKRRTHEFGRTCPHPAKEARAAVMRRLRADGFSTTQIGRWFGIDHSTVIYWTRSK